MADSQTTDDHAKEHAICLYNELHGIKYASVSEYHKHYRDAMVEKDGSIDLSQLRDDEILVAHGKIYRRLIK